MVAVVAFAKFAELPIELQLMVWESAAADIPARIVAVDVIFGKGATKFSNRTRVPRLLQTYRAPRRVSEKLYDTNIASDDRIIRLDGAKDTVLLFRSEGWRVHSVSAGIDLTEVRSHCALRGTYVYFIWA